MDGHATAVGGCIVDSGNFDWEAHADKYPGLCQPDDSYHGLTYTKTFGKLAYITKATSQLMRDLGSIQSPQNAFLLNLGLETLHLRMPQHCKNALAVAKWLQNCDKVAWVNYPDLEGNKYYVTDKEISSERFMRCPVIRTERRTRGSYQVYGQFEAGCYRYSCGRCPYLCASSGKPYASPVDRRTIEGSRYRSGPDPLLCRHRKCGRYHCGYRAGFKSVINSYSTGNRIV